MYAAFFALAQNPFSIAPDPRFLYLSGRHREALAHLLFGLDSGGGFVLLSGDIGTGKTTVCRHFLAQVPAHCNVAYIFNPQLTVLELLQTVCEEFHVPELPAASQTHASRTAKDYIDPLNRFLLNAHAAGRINVLIIDEAQNLSAPLLEQLRLLTNLETSERKLLQIMLIGQPELRQILARPELEQLAQRVIARHHLDALSQPEVQHYIAHRLGVAGHRGPLPFDRAAMTVIAKRSGGVPRRINLLCDRALLGAYAHGLPVVTRRVVLQAAREVFGTALPAEARVGNAPTIGVATTKTDTLANTVAAPAGPMQWAGTARASTAWRRASVIALVCSALGGAALLAFWAARAPDVAASSEGRWAARADGANAQNKAGAARWPAASSAAPSASTTLAQAPTAQPQLHARAPRDLEAKQAEEHIEYTPNATTSVAMAVTGWREPVAALLALSRLWPDATVAAFSAAANSRLDVGMNTPERSAASAALSPSPSPASDPTFAANPARAAPGGDDVKAAIAVEGMSLGHAGPGARSGDVGNVGNIATGVNSANAGHVAAGAAGVTGANGAYGTNGFDGHCKGEGQSVLHCAQSRTTLAVIRQLDRPGVLTLYDGQGRAFYVLLLGLSAHSALLQSGGSRGEVSLADLAAHWRGEFASLWLADVQAPGKASNAAARGASTPWAGSNANRQRNQIADFQRAQGLPADGRAGPMTLMQLNRANGVPEPRLSTIPLQR